MGKKKSSTSEVNLGKKFGKPDLERVGIFSEPSYISTNDPYINNNSSGGFCQGRTKGKQLVTKGGSQGYFGKDFSRIFENEAISDIVLVNRKWRKDEKAKNIVPSPFKPSNVPPKPSGSGSHFGTIEQQWPTLLPIKMEDFPEKPVKKNQDHKANFLTKPSKKGSGYGYPNITIGASYEYQSDPYDAFHQSMLEAIQEHKKKIVAPQTFVTGGLPQEYFSKFARLLYVKEGEEPADEVKPEKFLPAVPFKPSSYLTETINKYPVTEAELLEKLSLKATELSEKETQAKRAKTNKIFRPSGTSKSYPIRSIVDANCPIAAPAWIKEQGKKDSKNIKGK